MYAPDPVAYTHPYRINLARLFALEDSLRWNYPSYINAVPLVFDTPIGKVHRDALVSYDAQAGAAVFGREGKTFIYPDFPAELDMPGELETLLWRKH
jgi:lysine 2,3-aminomutase